MHKLSLAPLLHLHVVVLLISRPDRQLQDIVYKMVPFLEGRECRRAASSSLDSIRGPTWTGLTVGILLTVLCF